QEVVRMSDMLDDFRYEDSIEERRERELEGVAGSEADLSAFMFASHVIRQLRAEIVPRHIETELGERERKISLGRRDVEHARARGKDFGEETERFPPAIFISVGVTVVRNLAVDFASVVEEGIAPRLRPIGLRLEAFHSLKGEIGRERRPKLLIHCQGEKRRG